MRVDGQHGWILHARPYRETSLLLEGWSRDHGRIGLVARGVRKERPRQPRALLQPLVPLSLGWSGQGDLALLTGIDARGQPPAIAGDALVCAIYVNELVMRLLPRHDAVPDLFDAYEDTLQRLAASPARAWTLRRFERDLLAETGYGLVLEAEADSGAEIEADADYIYIPEHGLVPYAQQPNVLRLRGSALLALAEDRMPDAADLQCLRRLMRALITHQLGGASLRSWALLAGVPTTN
ncbi:MAG TPA: DNA repair protein RecO [Tahibacter sp.]|uniref:DNA repair protein RecO n=1 Tax=Tahibacter sp. TaxID=2056211 RepID=UPI002CC7E4E1|nr:DNA repair protein RecO [Tahibacter sp.]HSX59942.1 DNA repair protein RecO [Tahibacter sp.]